MKSANQQRGASFVFWVFILALLGFLVTIGIKLFPVYYDGLAAKAIVEEIAVQMQGKKPNKKQLWDTISKRLNINSIRNVKREHMVFNTKKKGIVEFGLNYEVRVPLIANLDGVVKFDYRETLNAKPEQN